uniref:AB hydrolase-1 domain-containing protein n=1 Tax=Populus trichocarpa TaxID=3694 RepID=A0A3N7FUX4_POPTR
MLRIFFSSFGPKPLIVPKETGFRGIPDPPCLPLGFSEEDIDFYANKFNQKGFTGALNYYRAINQTWDLMAPWIGVKIQVPVKFIIGDQDINYHLPGLKEYILNGGFKKDVPRLEEVVVMGGVAHFPNQARPEEVSEHIYSFFKKLQFSNNNPKANSTTSSLNGNRVSDLAHLHAL